MKEEIIKFYSYFAVPQLRVVLLVCFVFNKTKWWLHVYSFSVYITGATHSVFLLTVKDFYPHESERETK
jgi:hypothetical protein